MRFHCIVEEGRICVETKMRTWVNEIKVKVEVRYDRNRQLLEWTIHFGHNLLKALVVYFSRLYFSCKDEGYDYIISWHNKGAAVFESMFRE